MKDPGDSAKVCPECGADNITMARHCWMCHRDLTGVAVVQQAEPAALAARPTFAPTESSTVLVGIASALLVLVVGYGVATNGLGALIPFAIIAVPALLATLIRVGRKSARGEKVGMVETIGTFLLSGVAMVGLLFTLGLTLVVGLFLVCLAGGMRI